MNEPRPATKTMLFVYGTLKRGEPRHRYLAGQTLIASVATVPAYRLFSVGDYPALVRRDNGHSIEGELWEVDEACLRVLDQVEGVEQGLYAREPIEVLPPHDGANVATYVYRLSVDGLPDCGTRW
jgi:gamma-glutamylaminecyclotransferase